MCSSHDAQTPLAGRRSILSTHAGSGDGDLSSRNNPRPMHAFGLLLLSTQLAHTPGTAICCLATITTLGNLDRMRWQRCTSLGAQRSIPSKLSKAYTVSKKTRARRS